MYLDTKIRSYVIVGTVIGLGYDCRSDNVATFKESDSGVWNRVSYWVDWIKEKMEEFGENQCIPQNYKRVRNINKNIHSIKSLYQNQNFKKSQTFAEAVISTVCTN